MLKIPPLFLERLKIMLPQSEDQLSYLSMLDQPLRQALRINTLNISVDNFLKNINSKKWQLNPVLWNKRGFFIDRQDRSIPLGTTPEHQSGEIYIQEAISMLPVDVLQPQAGSIILDMAASPGSKTTYMADLMGNTGFILANDLSSKRIKGLISNIKRLGIVNTAVTRKNALKLSRYFSHTFDKVLLDAPCTGEGLIRKDRTVLQKWSESNIRIMSKLQKQMIDVAFDCLKTGGEMVYSTCTLTPEENEEVIDHLIRKYGGLLEIIDLKNVLSEFGIDKNLISQTTPVLEFGKKKYHSAVQNCLRIWPQIFNTEGFFVAKIKKLKKLHKGIAPIPSRKKIFQQSGTVLKVLQSKERKRIESYIKKYFGYDFKFKKEWELVKIQYEIYLRSPYSERFFQQVRFEYNGIMIFREIRDELMITHEGVSLWGKTFTKHILKLSEEEYKTYLSGHDLSIDNYDLALGTIILMYNSFT